jgi:hypothetical protein
MGRAIAAGCRQMSYTDEVEETPLCVGQHDCGFQSGDRAMRAAGIGTMSNDG